KRPIDRPTCETTRDLLYVFLGIAAINSQGVKFHQLARVVFVYSWLASGRTSRLLRVVRLSLWILRSALLSLFDLFASVQARIRFSEVAANRGGLCWVFSRRGDNRVGRFLVC